MHTCWILTAVENEMDKFKITSFIPFPFSSQWMNIWWLFDLKAVWTQTVWDSRCSSPTPLEVIASSLHFCLAILWRIDAFSLNRPETVKTNHSTDFWYLAVHYLANRNVCFCPAVMGLWWDFSQEGGKGSKLEKTSRLDKCIHHHL